MVCALKLKRECFGVRTALLSLAQDNVGPGEPLAVCEPTLRNTCERLAAVRLGGGE
jgi:hypothetical protein